MRLGSLRSDPHGAEPQTTMTRLERRVNITAVLLPFLVVAVAVPWMWGGLLGTSDVIVFAVMYVRVRLG